MKQVIGYVGQSGGERSEPGPTQAQCLRFAGSDTSFFFHPVAQNRSISLLLSSFTHPHAYAPAPARERSCVRGVVKEERSLPGCRRRAVRSPTLARVEGPSRLWPSDPAQNTPRHAATRRTTSRLPEWQGRIGTSGQTTEGDARGNSRRLRHSLFLLSEETRGERHE